MVGKRIFRTRTGRPRGSPDAPNPRELSRRVCCHACCLLARTWRTTCVTSRCNIFLCHCPPNFFAWPKSSPIAPSHNSNPSHPCFCSSKTTMADHQDAFEGQATWMRPCLTCGGCYWTESNKALYANANLQCMVVRLTDDITPDRPQARHDGPFPVNGWKPYPLDDAHKSSNEPHNFFAWHKSSPIAPGHSSNTSHPCFSSKTTMADRQDALEGEATRMRSCLPCGGCYWTESNKALYGNR